MADTRAQGKVEAWVRNEWLPREFGQQFLKAKIQLSSGGKFEFDAVSSDGKFDGRGHQVAHGLPGEAGEVTVQGADLEEERPEHLRTLRSDHLAEIRQGRSDRDS